MHLFQSRCSEPLSEARRKILAQETGQQTVPSENFECPDLGSHMTIQEEWTLDAADELAKLAGLSHTSHTLPGRFFRAQGTDFTDVCDEPAPPSVRPNEASAAVSRIKKAAPFPSRAPPPPQSAPPRSASEPNKLTDSTTEVIAGLQTSGRLTVSQIQDVGHLDSKRVYDVINGLVWAGLISHDPRSKSYHYLGVDAPVPIDLKNLAPNMDLLRRQRDQKAALVRELKERLDLVHAIKTAAGAA
jgi:hypothetical protein